MLLTLACALLGTLIGAGQASAEPEYPSFYETAVPANGRVFCYGYGGTFKVGTYVVVVDWKSSSDECFGISTDRTIWHAWPNSGGWKKMGGGGYADTIAPLLFLEDRDTKERLAVVYTASSNKFWCQLYRLPGGWTNSWYECYR
ncbi:hypothetical protein [Saccharothrix stipae]